MKKTTFLKSLLLVACIMLGGSAWAEPTSLYERGTTNAWSNADLTDWPCDAATPTISGGLSVTSTNGGWACTKTISVTEGSKVTLKATLKTGGANGRSGSYDYVQIGGIKVCFNEQDKVAFVDIDGITTNLDLSYARTSSYSIEVVIDQAQSVVSYTVGSVTGSSTSATSVDKVVFGHYKAGRENYEINPVLQKVEVLEEAQDFQTAAYKLKYVAGDVTVKEVNLTGVIGSTIALTAEQKANFTKDEVKYIYESDNASEQIITSDGNAVATLIYHVAGNYTYTVNGTYGASGSKVVASGSLLEGESETYYYPGFILDGTKLYKKNKNSTNPYFGGTINMGNANQDITIAYNDDVLENVVFYAEGEDMAGATASSSANANIRCSNGKGGFFEADATIVNLPAGKYTIWGQVWGNSGVTFAIKANGTDVWSCETVGYLNSVTSEIFELTEATDLVIPASGNSGKVLDLIYIVKVEDAQVNVTSAGYATYCSPYALDLTGIDAYTATQTGSTVKFVSQKDQKVAAGTGLLIKASAGTLTIPVATSGATTVENNALIGVLKETKVPAGSFVLLKEGDNVGFYMAEAEFTVRANSAYIKALPSPVRFIGLDDITAVSSVTAVQNAEGAIFDLQGRRVAQPVKGLYIVNGKKVVVK